MMKKLLSYLLLACAPILISCGSNSTTDVFTNPVLVAVDSTNDRLFILENEGVLSVLTASTRASIGDVPFVQSDREVTIYNLLPNHPTYFKALTNGSSTRLFIGGSQVVSATPVLNQVLVLDFDGTTLEAASFSPLSMQDNDDNTDDSQHVIGGMEIDVSQGRLYMTDSTLGVLYQYDTSDGSLLNSVSINGTPNQLSLTGQHLFVANSSDTADEQVITVVDTSDMSTTTIDLDLPSSQITTVDNGQGVVLMFKQSNAQQVHLVLVNTSTYASASYMTGADSTLNGILKSGNGLSSSVGSLQLSYNSTAVYGYVGQSDGTIEVVTIQSDLSEYSLSSLLTSGSLLSNAALYQNNSGSGTVYMAASGSGDLVFTDVGATTTSYRP